jgi:EmrB/QacA subfamily drug resistance transporter
MAKEFITSFSLADREGRRILFAAALGSGMVLLDSLVLNVALPTIGADLRTSGSSLQELINSYLLALTAVTLVGGILGDRIGHSKVLAIGFAVFGCASAMCATSVSITMLIAFRIIQGMAGALLIPNGLALIRSRLRASDHTRAIGLWTSSGAVISAASPALGGWITDVPGWRWIFLINVPFAIAGICILVYRSPRRSRLHPIREISRFDTLGATLCIILLATITSGLMDVANGQPTNFSTLLLLGIGAAALMIFIAIESRSQNSLLPFRLFRTRSYAIASGITILLNFVLASALYTLVLNLEIVYRQSALRSGLYLIPFSLAMLFVSPATGRTLLKVPAARMTMIGLLLASAGTAMIGILQWHYPPVIAIMPCMLLYGTGVAVCQPALTAWTLAVGGGQNNGAAGGLFTVSSRIGALLGLVVLPGPLGLAGNGYLDAATVRVACSTTMFVSAGLLLGAACASCCAGPGVASD